MRVRARAADADRLRPSGLADLVLRVKVVPLLEVALSTTNARLFACTSATGRSSRPTSSDLAVQRVPLREVQPLAIEVVGLFDVKDPQASFWFGDPTLDTPDVRQSQDLDRREVYAQALVSPTATQPCSAATRPLPLTYEHRYFVETGPLRRAAGLGGSATTSPSSTSRYGGCGPARPAGRDRAWPVARPSTAPRARRRRRCSRSRRSDSSRARSRTSALLGALSYDRRRRETGLSRTRGASPPPPARRPGSRGRLDRRAGGSRRAGPWRCWRSMPAAAASRPGSRSRIVAAHRRSCWSRRSRAWRGVRSARSVGTTSSSHGPSAAPPGRSRGWSWSPPALGRLPAPPARARGIRTAARRLRPVSRRRAGAARARLRHRRAAPLSAAARGRRAARAASAAGLRAPPRAEPSGAAAGLSAAPAARPRPRARDRLLLGGDGEHARSGPEPHRLARDRSRSPHRRARGREPARPARVAPRVDRRRRAAPMCRTPGLGTGPRRRSCWRSTRPPTSASSRARPRPSPADRARATPPIPRLVPALVSTDWPSQGAFRWRSRTRIVSFLTSATGRSFPASRPGRLSRSFR